MVGHTIGHYRILEKLGAGGMGEVYRAEDTTLKRQVALKVLPAELASSPERLERFQREAESLAALNHPNIVTIYTVEEAEGVRFLTMELVEGRALSQVIASGGLALARIFEITVPLADALAKAHDKGIIHRDLKPANVMVSDEARVKVLDFGLAKLRQEVTPAEATALPTEPLTQDGLILGTLPYMSPEQLEGQELDTRSDIFSFGVILYEMATGERPFQGDSSASLIMSIGRDQPPGVDAVRQELPHHLGRVVSRCLEKDPENRYQSVKDVRNELRTLQNETEAQVTPASAISVAARMATQRRWWPALIVAGLVLLALISWQMLRSRPASVESRSVIAESTETSRALERKMIVVLPFENLGPPEDTYFADGMTEEVTSRLASVSGLGVISRTSATQYDRTGKTIKELGADLGVDFVLEGTVRWNRPEAGPSRVLVTPQLIRVADDTHIWSDRYDRELEDIFTVQAEVAQQVISLLEVNLLEPEKRRVETRPTENMEAYQFYLRGMANISRSGGLADQDWHTAEKMFQQATEIDPAFALAFARLSRSQSTMIWLDIGGSDWEQARQAADKALNLQPDLPEAHQALGFIYYRAEQDYGKALEHFSAAADARPSESTFAMSIAAVHRRRGDRDQALTAFQKAATLDPRSSGAAWELALTLQWLRRFSDADAEYARSIHLGPDQWTAYVDRATNRIHWTGNLSEARRLGAKAPSSAPARYSHWHWYTQLWLERDYEELLKRVLESGEFHCMTCISIYRRLYEAAAYQALGNEERAKAAYETAVVKLQNAPLDSADAASLRIRLGEAYAGLGQKDAAIREGRRAVELFPTSKDAFSGPFLEEGLARIYLMVGETEAALELLDHLLSIPSQVSVKWLRLDPTWDPIRDDPRFQAMLEKCEQMADS